MKFWYYVLNIKSNYFLIAKAEYYEEDNRRYVEDKEDVFINTNYFLQKEVEE